MRRVYIIFISLLVLAGGFLFAEKNVTTDDAAVLQNLTDHLNFFCSDELKGRKGGSEEGKLAADYIFNQFRQIGLNPQMEPFSKGKYRNVVAEIPSKNGRYVVIGAHYDHLGTSFGNVYNGADDNASGTSVLIEVARMLHDREQNLKYGVIFVAFDGEEKGLLGSRYNAGQLKNGDKQVSLMMNMDMVGHLKHEGRLICEGTASFTDGDRMVRDNQIDGMSIRIYPTSPNTGVLTDIYSYEDAGIPVLSLSTGEETSNYHRFDDDIETLDIPGMVLVARQMVAFAENIPDTIEPTGVSVYEDKTVSFSLTYEMLSKSQLFTSKDTAISAETLSIGMGSALPVGKIIGGNLFICPELNYRVYTCTLNGEKGYTHQITVPVSVALNQKVFGIEMSSQFGAYYSVAFDKENNVHQEIGAKIGWSFRPYNNIDTLNHFGIGLNIYYGLLNISNSSSCKTQTTKNASFAITYYF